mmetsp:Transcript_3205/g.7597  ORF Transcript_3205/g.7597 Transcript_3205/m.7597 type:complete len:373 (-) Transcript_3205:1214-2332(-)
MIPTSIRAWGYHRIRKEALTFGSRQLTKGKSGFGKFFSSSSSNKDPKLSARNKRDLLILAVGICGALGYHLIHRDDDWEEDVWTLQNKLKSSSSGKNELFSPQGNSFSKHPPPIVLRYIEKVLQQPASSLRISSFLVTAHQSGEFLASRQWYPFEATLMAAASNTNPGFVWDARTTILKLSNNVLEYLITKGDEGQMVSETEGGVVTKVWGKYPLIQVEEEDPYLLFWLAMTPLFPAVFLDGREGMLKWMDNDVVFDEKRTIESRKEASASAQLADGTDTRLLVEFFFEEDGLLHKIKVTQQENTEPWQAVYKNYSHHAVAIYWNDGTNEQDRHDPKSHQILIPSYIEIGKGEGDQYHSHFKIYNRNIGFES